MTISNRIKKIREDKQITQEALAQAAGVSRQTIIAIEKGNYIPSLLLAMNIANYFNMPIDELFTIKK